MNSKAYKLLTAMAAAGALSLVAGSADAQDVTKCKATIAKETAKASQALAKNYQKCEAGVLAGKITGPCPDAKTATGIQKVKDKLSSALTKACTGVNVNEAYGYASCPNANSGTSAGSGPCTGTVINDAGDLGTCLGCLADEHAAEQFSGVIYDGFVASMDKDVTKCQSTIGKSILGYYNAKLKALAKCQDAVFKGKLPGPCPDAAANDAIAKAEDKKLASIAKACCGDDGVCGGTCTVQGVGDDCDKDADCQRCVGGTNAGNFCVDDDFCPGGTCSTDGVCDVGAGEYGPATLGFLAQCPAIAVGGAPIVADPGSSMAGVITCFNTQADQRAECSDKAGIGAAASNLCAAPPTPCGADGTDTVAVVIASATPLGSLTLSVGYDNDRVNLAGTGTDANALVTPIQAGLFTANDLDDSVTIGGTDVATGFTGGVLVTLDVQTCGAVLAASDFGCVVTAASNTLGAAVTGVTCTVTP